MNDRSIDQRFINIGRYGTRELSMFILWKSLGEDKYEGTFQIPGESLTTQKKGLDFFVSSF